MSLKPTERNRVCGIMLSAKDWARHAIGSDKQTGPEGFEKFRSGDWWHTRHYKLIRTPHPEWSPPEAGPEMAEMRERLVRDIQNQAEELDEMIMRLQRMEEQMNEAAKE